MPGGIGSSPLARGLPRTDPANAYPARIIPARAGFTQLSHRYARVQNGSSPLARGLHSHGQGAHDVAGIIPARAGFTH